MNARYGLKTTERELKKVGRASSWPSTWCAEAENGHRRPSTWPTGRRFLDRPATGPSRWPTGPGRSSAVKVPSRGDRRRRRARPSRDILRPQGPRGVPREGRRVPGPRGDAELHGRRSRRRAAGSRSTARACSAGPGSGWAWRWPCDGRRDRPYRRGGVLQRRVQSPRGRRADRRGLPHRAAEPKLREMLLAVSPKAVPAGRTIDEVDAQRGRRVQRRAAWPRPTTPRSWPSGRGRSSG